MRRASWWICTIGLAVGQALAVQEIRIGIYVLNLGKLDIATGLFSADFYLLLQSDQPITPNSFEFVNGRATSVELLESSPDGTELFYRILANLNTPIDLKRFPFDAQVMRIALEERTNNLQRVRYVPLPSKSGMDPAIVFPGWKIEGWEMGTSEHAYEVYGEVYSQAVFSVRIRRILFNSFLKTFLPALFMMLIVMSSFVLNPEQVPTRLAAISSTLIATAMFHVSISNQIPPVGYLTFADKFMVLTYFILLACFFLSLHVFVLQGRKEEARAKKISRITERIVFVGAPTLYALLFLFVR